MGNQVKLFFTVLRFFNMYPHDFKIPTHLEMVGNPDIVPQIIEYKNLQNRYSILGCFWQPWLRRNKDPKCHKYATFEVIFMVKKTF